MPGAASPRPRNRLRPPVSPPRTLPEEPD